MMNRICKAARLIMLTAAVVSISAVCAEAAVKITYRTPDSKCRKVDKTGAIVGKELWKEAEPGIGVGNVIFASAPLPYDKESTYTGVGTKFSFKNLTELNARAYYPGRKGDIIKYIEAEHPGYKFIECYMVLQFFKPNGMDNHAIIVSEEDEETLPRDQAMWYLLPKTDTDNLQIGNIITNGDAGEYEVQISYYAKFKTGKTRLVTRSDDDKIVTTREDILKEFLLVYGECKITK